MDKKLIINRIKDYKNFTSDKELSDFLGITPQTLSSWKSRNSLDYDLIFAKCEGIDLSWLITGLRSSSNMVEEPVIKYGLRTDQDLENQRIPLYNIEAAAGIVQLFSHQHADKPIDYLHIPGIPKCDGAVYVTGDSMYPLLKSGDIAMYKEIKDLSTAIFFWGEMYLIAVDNDGDEFVVVKYVQKSDLGSEYIKLVSYNQHHAPVDIHKSKIKALALVKGSVRINSMG